MYKLRDINTESFINFKNFIKNNLGPVDNVMIGLPNNINNNPKDLLIEINIIRSVINMNIINIHVKKDLTLYQINANFSTDRLEMLKDYIINFLVEIEEIKEIKIKI
jgi:hypothetical protein